MMPQSVLWRAEQMIDGARPLRTERSNDVCDSSLDEQLRMGAVQADAPGRQSEDHRLGAIGVRCGNVRQPIEPLAGIQDDCGADCRGAAVRPRTGAEVTTAGRPAARGRLDPRRLREVEGEHAHAIRRGLVTNRNLEVGSRESRPVAATQPLPSLRRKRTRACGRLPAVPVSDQSELHGRQTVYPAACRRERSRPRAAERREGRDRGIRVLLETVLRKLEEGSSWRRA
jgi:hypothetical protein